MARRSPRPEATQEKLLTPLKERCEQCGHPLWVANHSHRTVTTPSGLWKLTLVVRQCIEPTRPRFHQWYRPEEKGGCAFSGEFKCKSFYFMSGIEVTTFSSQNPR